MTDRFDFFSTTEPVAEDGYYLEPNVIYFEEFMRNMDDELIELPNFGDAA